MKIQPIALAAILISIVSSATSLYVLMERKQNRAETFARELNQAVDFSMKALTGSGRSPSSVRVSGDFESGYKCSAHFSRGTAAVGDGASPTAACLRMLDQSTN